MYGPKQRGGGISIGVPIRLGIFVNNVNQEDKVFLVFGFGIGVCGVSGEPKKLEPSSEVKTPTTSSPTDYFALVDVVEMATMPSILGARAGRWKVGEEEFSFFFLFYFLK